MRWRHRILLLGLFAAPLSSCDRNGDSEPVYFDSSGGEHTYDNGMTLIVPAGALSERTEIALRDLTEEELGVLLEARDISADRLLFAFSAEPHGLQFATPVEVIVPAPQLTAEMLPVIAELELEARRVTVADLTYTTHLADGSLSLEMLHFSGYAAEIIDELKRQECTDPSNTTCRCGDIDVSQTDYDASCSVAECQVMYSENRVTFLDCAGQPDESSIFEESSPGCIAALDLTPGQPYLDFGEQTELKAQLRLGCAQRYPGREVTFFATGPGTIRPDTDVTGDEGWAATTLTAGEEPGTVVLAAEATLTYFTKRIQVNGVELTKQEATKSLVDTVDVLIRGEACAEAPILFAMATDLHDALSAAIPFDTTWQATVHFEDITPPRMDSSWMPASYDYLLGSEKIVEATLTMTIPPIPRAISCEEAAYIESIWGEGPDAEEIVYGYYIAALSGVSGLGQSAGCDLFVGTGLEDLFCDIDWFILLDGNGVSSWNDRGRRVFDHCQPETLLVCCLPSACPFTTWTGCEGQTTHTFDAQGGISLDALPAVRPEAMLLDLQVSPDFARDQTQVQQWCEFSSSGDPTHCALCDIISDPCCYDRCMAWLPQNAERTEACSGPPAMPREWTFVLKEGRQVLASMDTAVHRSSLQLLLHCASGCECHLDSECDDGQACTRDACTRGNCSSLADDTLAPEAVEGDCRYCSSGVEYSALETHEEECEPVRREALESCAALGEDWRVHWVSETPGSASQWHYCLGGESPASEDEPFCTGAGDCASGSPFTSLQGSRSATCVSPDGQELDFSCEVSCTVCR